MKKFLLAIKSKDYWMGLKGLATVLIICVIVFIIIYSLTWMFKKPNEAGDTAGLVNGLFSALAFAGVIYAIFLQRNELELQRDELAETRKEFIKENDTLKRQRFENTFFNMLQLQQHITENIYFSYRDTTLNLTELHGREVFYKSFEEIVHRSSSGRQYHGMRGLIAAEGIIEYENNNTPTYYDHYFRHLYRIFKYIDESDLINNEDRYEYACTVRAQLSRYELIWLYYNSLSSFGRERFKPLVEKYALLNNIREDLLVEGSDIRQDYNESAFEHLNG